jgi:hypothetical protein
MVWYLLSSNTSCVKIVRWSESVVWQQISDHRTIYTHEVLLDNKYPTIVLFTHMKCCLTKTVISSPLFCIISFEINKSNNTCYTLRNDSTELSVCSIFNSNNLMTDLFWSLTKKNNFFRCLVYIFKIEINHWNTNVEEVKMYLK